MSQICSKMYGRVTAGDGASSLKLIEIHENIDRKYPGQVDLTELFDYPTIAELATHLEGKLAARS